MARKTSMWRKKLVVIAVVVLGIGAFATWLNFGVKQESLRLSSQQGADAQLTATGHRKHFIQNTSSSDASKLKSMGYNIQDVNPDSSSIRSLPSGVQAMVWTGDAFCGHGMKWDSFKKFVSANRSNTKIYGYFLIDEPQTHKCSSIAKVIRDRADYIHCLAIASDKYSNGRHKVASDGSCLNDKGQKTARKTPHKAYIVDEYNYDYAKVRESITHVDLFAIDPYPCRPKGCKFSGGGDYFRERIARAKTYFTDSHIVPTYQAFGGDGWKMPTSTQMKQILAEYDKALPKVEMDVVYSYRDNKSGGPGDTYPGLIRSSSLQQILKAHNAKY
jgi:hypothetical protein